MSSTLSWYLYDSAAARLAEPFALTRPLGELRAGACLIRERWAHALGVAAVGHVAAPHLERFSEVGAPRSLSPNDVLPAGSLLVDSRFAPRLASLPTAGRLRCDGRFAAIRLHRATPARDLLSGSAALADLPAEPGEADIDGWWLDRPWDAIRFLVPMLLADIPVVAAGGPPPPHATVLGHHAVTLEADVTVEPMVVFDASAGPILLRRGASVAAFTRLVGPCVVGEGTQLMAGRIGTSSFGPSCRVCGEVSQSIFIGYANKGHDGFLGHSMLGRWANLGAGTTTSNLKNTYGTVVAWAPDGEQDTGLQFLGTLLGDHAKTAIGTRLTTGAVVGAGANVLADGLTPKVIAPFAFGASTYRLDKFLEVAERVMSRRQVTLDADQRECLAAAFAARWRL